MMGDTKIFYLCYDHQNPGGGQKTMYRHVDILNRNGIDAYAFHRKEGFSISWFPHETRIVYLSEFQKIYNPNKDIIVVPEDLGTLINDIRGQKVILNQNCYYGFYCFDFKRPKPYPYLRSDIKGVIAVSEHNKNYLNFAYPNLKIHKVYCSVDPSVFPFEDIENKEKKIACLPQKNPMDLSQLYHIALSRAEQGLNRVDEYEWVFIQDKSEQEVARIFKRSLIFVFLSTQEGFGIMPLEAMLTGGTVLAYHHGPPTEYLKPDNSFTSEQHDILSLAANLENVTELFSKNPEKLRNVGRAAHLTACEYSLEREEQSLLKAWKDILL
ncbi:MAG: glycosyltransferase family 4 protein [Proteobacteria bacterium]|nr:glycosyltransferase family 4 protein [Pseudomonadota bacterium]